MARYKTTGTIRGVTYTVTEASPLDYAREQLLVNRISAEVPKESPILVTQLETYAALVVRGQVSGLVTLDDEPVNFLGFAAPSDAHFEALNNFLSIPLAVYDALKKAVDEVNAPLVPAHIKPPEQVTPEERSDPNSSPAGDTTRSD
ncbi:MAG: hypothetical protein SF029_24650 [bacterium]|nr:hypothetical protein [bacterium]